MLGSLAPRFGGVEWEAFCRQALEQKYPTRWQKIPSRNKGDWGIEGFVRPDGIVVQCYAADAISNSAQTDAQKAKLTRDIPKLRTNSAALSSHLGMTVETYCFIVPSFDDKDLLDHVTVKRDLVRKWNLSWISPNFEIVVKDFDFFVEEWAILQGNVGQRLHLEQLPDDPASVAPLAPQNALIDQLRRKLEAIPRLAGDEARRRDWEALLLKHYVHAKHLYTQLEERNPRLADAVLEVKAGRELELETRSDVSEPIDDLVALSADLRRSLRASVNSLAENDAVHLAWGAIGDWLMRCPLEYRA